MNDFYNTNSTPPMINASGLKEYHCPHCDKFLFKGNVKNLNMVCQHCQKMIKSDEDELFQKDNQEISDE